MPSTDCNSRYYVKSYFASSIEAAMEQAQAELGPDALLLNSREAPPEARHQGAYEVVFGSRPPSAPTLAGVPDPVDDLRKRMDELRELVARIGIAGNTRSSSVGDMLLEAGIEPSLAVNIESAVEHRLRNQSVIQMGRAKPAAGWDPAAVLRETEAEMAGHFDACPTVGNVTALVGPPGSGKTTCIVKLAITEGLAKRRPVRLISADYVRIAAAMQLQTYAELLGVPFTFADSHPALIQAIDSASPETLTLVDTAGYTGATSPESVDLAHLLQGRQDIDTHLVLTASMRLADLRRTVDRFAAFRPNRLLFTRLDETDSTAAIFSEAARTGKPLSFFSTGPLVPEDWETASVDRIVRPLVRQLPLYCEAVA
jgi:flagellar biosynthesis protein FlhF